MKITKDHIIRYLKGKLPEAERHNLEMLILDDLFLSDAIEGLSRIEKPEQAGQLLDQIEKEIRRKSDIASLPFYTRYRYGIAAALSLLIVSVVLVLLYREKQATPMLAQYEEKDSRQITGTDTTTMPEGKMEAIDRTKPEADELSGDDTLFAEEGTAIKATEEDLALEMPVIVGQEADTSARRTAIADAGAGGDNLPATAAEEMTDDQLIEAEAEEVDVEAISEVLIDIDTQEAPVNLTEPAQKTRQRAQVQDQAVKRQATEVSGIRTGDAFIVEYSVTDNENRDAAQIFDRYPNPSVSSEAYSSYMKNNMVLSQEAIDDNVSGMVVVVFSVSASGELTGFEVLESPGYGTGEEVVRLIKSGPSWLPARKDGNETAVRVKMAVHFDAE